MVWGPEQWRDAVAAFPVRGVLTTMLQEAQVACARLGLQVSVHAEAFLIRNLLPDQVEGVLRALDVARWTRDIAPAVRLVASSQGEDNRLPVGVGPPAAEI
eukprot:9641318-Lingulodinium_polyedra.AAC.1